MLNTVNGSVSAAGATQQLDHQAGEILDKVLAAAQPGVVFSAPVVSGQYTIIMASEVFAGGAYGFGSGGGGSRGRPVAVVVIGPDGVRVQPIVDATRVALAVMAALGGMTLMAMRRRACR